MPSKILPKLYPIHQSPLFRLLSKRRFESVIGVSWDAVPDLLASKSYRTWTNENGREIQAPILWMATVHRRIANLLGRIELPDYLFSRKGRSYADNTRQHIGNQPLVKTDISKFYPSTTRRMVLKMFLEDFQCATDVANRLADICCYKQEHLPTGSPLSGRVAFFAARHMFDEIAVLASASDCKMTAYVDDITLSGRNASKALLGKVRKIVSNHGLVTKQKKSKTFAANAAKTVTGAVIVGNEIRLPNQRHKRISEAHQDVRTSSGSNRAKAVRVLRGRLQEASQVLGNTSTTQQTEDKVPNPSAHLPS